MPTAQPSLTLPASKTVATNGTIDLTGISFTDSSAAANPGAMYLRITDSSGALRATNAAGVVVAGSGSTTITLTVPYADVTAVLASLQYDAAATAGSDTINFDLWDQAGVETTGSIAIGVTASSTMDTWLGTVSGNWNTAANWSTGVVPQTGDQVTIPGGTSFIPTLVNAILTGETISLTAGGTGPALNFSNVTLGAGTVLQNTAPNLTSTATLNLTGTLTVGAGASMTAASGTLFEVHSASVTDPAMVVNQGTIATDGGHLNIDTGGTVVNNGLILATNSGGVGFDPALHPGMAPPDIIVNTGTLEVASGTLFINGTLHGGTLLFSGAGSLVLEAPNALTDDATIVGFGTGNSINVNQVTSTSLAFANGVLSVLNGTAVAEALPLRGSYISDNFSMAFQPGNQPSWVISYVPSATVGPQITAPASEQVTASGTIAVSGVSVADSYAATHPGTLALNLTDAAGTISMTDTTGLAVAGSGTVAIHYSGTLAQINAALATLIYAAPANAGGDSLSIDVWDQAGQEATQSIAVTIGAAAGSSPPPTGSVINGTPGDDSIVSNLNNVTINAGTGNNFVFAGGSGDVIMAGDGNNTIQAFNGGNRITTGAGDDMIQLAGSGSTVNAGGGRNTIQESGSGNTLVLPSAGQGSDDIYGYVLTANDMLDIHGALAAAGWGGNQAVLGSYVSVGTVNDGADATVSIRPGGGSAASVVATLHGSGAVSLQTLLAHAIT